MGGQTLASQLIPHPHPLFFACGFSDTRNVLPISSVAKSIVAPLTSTRDMASTMTLAGRVSGWENVLYRCCQKRI